MTIARLPHARELSDFDFAAGVDEPTVRSLADDAFIKRQRNLLTGDSKRGIPGIFRVSVISFPLL